MVTTTIQISKELLKDLKSRKMYNRESYEDVRRFTRIIKTNIIKY